jgi:hypothetical protein
MRILAKQRRVVNEDIPTDDCLDGIEDSRMSRKIVRPAVKQVQIARLRGIGPGTKFLAKHFIIGTKFCRFLRLQHGDWEENPVSPVDFDRVFAQWFDHSALNCQVSVYAIE